MNPVDDLRPTYGDLENRLLELEQVIEALRDHQVDAIVGESDVAMVHLRQVEEALRDSGERYRAFVANNSEGIGRYEIEPPMPLTLPDDQQVAYILEHGVVGECNDAMARLAGYQWAGDMIGRPAFAGPTEPYLVAALSQFVRANYRVNYLEVPQLDVQGDPRWLAVSFLGIPREGKLGRIWGVQRDITECRRAEQDLRQRTSELSALLAVTRDLAGTLELEPLLETVLARLHTVIDFAGATVSMREGDDLVTVAYEGALPREQILSQRSPLDALLPLAQLTRTGQPAIFNDVAFTDLLAEDIRPRIAAMLPLGEDVRSWLLAPLLVKNSLIGVLILGHRLSQGFTPRQADLAQAFADHAAVAIENARLYAEARQVAALNERQRLAAELHDSFSQAIYSMALAAHSGLANVEKRPDKTRAAFHHILTLAEGAFADIRSLIFELRPESLARQGLVLAMERQAETLRNREHAELHLDLGPEPNAPLETKETLYRVAQEAMNNIVKHARAKNVWLRLAVEGQELCLEVRDDGRGFDATRDYAGHLGLRVMRERAEKLGGCVSITSAARGGTTIIARLPICNGNK